MDEADQGNAHCSDLFTDRTGRLRDRRGDAARRNPVANHPANTLTRAADRHTHPTPSDTLASTADRYAHTGWVPGLLLDH